MGCINSREREQEELNEKLWIREAQIANISADRQAILYGTRDGETVRFAAMTGELLEEKCYPHTSVEEWAHNEVTTHMNDPAWSDWSFTVHYSNKPIDTNLKIRLVEEKIDC
jgi:hypothetical protein